MTTILAISLLVNMVVALAYRALWKETVRRWMRTENAIGQFVDALEFDTLVVCAGILNIEPDEQSWLDDGWPDREDKLRVAVAEAMMKVGQK